MHQEALGAGSRDGCDGRRAHGNRCARLAEDAASRRHVPDRHDGRVVADGSGAHLSHLFLAGRVRDLREAPQLPGRARSRGSRLVPEIAAGMPDVSEDGLTYTFQIRNDFAFSPPASES